MAFRPEDRSLAISRSAREPGSGRLRPCSFASLAPPGRSTTKPPLLSRRAWRSLRPTRSTAGHSPRLSGRRAESRGLKTKTARQLFHPGIQEFPFEESIGEQSLKTHISCTFTFHHFHKNLYFLLFQTPFPGGTRGKTGNTILVLLCGGNIWFPLRGAKVSHNHSHPAVRPGP